MIRRISPILSQAWANHQQGPFGIAQSRHGGGNAPILELVKVTASSIFEVVLLSFVGYLMARRGIIDKKTQTKINKLNVSIFTPALLFSKVAFSLNAARLVELAVVPIGFVATTFVSASSAYLLSKLARISRPHRNFAVACAISPNSNSLPVALMQSLVVTVPMLHWEEDGEPEDTTDGMLGRALTYLVLFSTLGMFLRWSVGAKLLSSVDEEVAEREVPVGTLIDHDSGADDSAQQQQQQQQRSQSADSRSRPERKRSGPPGWAVSFPNSPTQSDADEQDYGNGQTEEIASGEQRSLARSCAARTSSVAHKLILKPLLAINAFMTAPLWAAFLSLFVALIRPLQQLIGSMEPVVGALETAGGCSIPLTMVILGAYFHVEPAAAEDNSKAISTTTQSAATSSTAVEGLSRTYTDEDGQSEARFSSRAESVASLTEDAESPSATQKWRVSSYNPWRSVSANTPQRAGDPEEPNGGRDADERTRLLPGPSAASTRRSSARREENWTIAIAIASRMIVTPLVLVPIIAWYAIVTRYNVVDDPVFIACACLIVGSPPALTLAQITSQSAKGNKSFERLISKTIFVSYTFLAAPTTIILVLLALLIAEND